AAAAVRSVIPAKPITIARPCGATCRTVARCQAPSRSSSTTLPVATLGAPAACGQKRSSPPSPCGLPSSPTATAAGAAGATAGGASSLLFEDLEDDLPVGAGRDGIQDGPDGFGGTPLLADDAPDVFAGDLEFEHRRRVALCLLHLDGVGMIHQLLR